MSARTAAATGALFTLALITGCSMAHGDPKHPGKNPHPVQRYEVIATSDAPGPWDSVHGYISYEVVNPACTPKNEFEGVHELPQDVGVDVEMTRVDSKTWRGYFYRDAVLDEDYYGLGVCHWDATSVGGVFTVRGGTFSASDTLPVLLKKSSETEYFKKSEFENHANTDGGYGTPPTDPEVANNPDAYFPISVAVKEVKP